MQSNIVTWTPGMSLENIERQVIVAAYSHYRGNKTATAQSLGIAIRTLDNKLDKYKELDDSSEKRMEEVKRRRDEFDQRSRGDVNSINNAVNFSGTPVAYKNKSEKIKTETPFGKDETKEVSKNKTKRNRKQK